MRIEADCLRLKPTHAVPFETGDNKEVVLGSILDCAAKDCPIYIDGGCAGRARVNVLINTPKGSFINVYPTVKK